MKYITYIVVAVLITYPGVSISCEGQYFKYYSWAELKIRPPKPMYELSME